MNEDTLLIVCVKWYENLRLQVGDVSLLDDGYTTLAHGHYQISQEVRARTPQYF